jgi:hypothetical protein
VYHFVKSEPVVLGLTSTIFLTTVFPFQTCHSMIATHPFETARESVLPLWSQTAQARCSASDARAPELFVLLHGMLFTNIQLDDFSVTLARLLELLTIEEPEGREWTMGCGQHWCAPRVQPTRSLATQALSVKSIVTRPPSQQRPR